MCGIIQNFDRSTPAGEWSHTGALYKHPMQSPLPKFSDTWVKVYKSLSLYHWQYWSIQFFSLNAYKFSSQLETMTFWYWKWRSRRVKSQHWLEVKPRAPDLICPCCTTDVKTGQLSAPTTPYVYILYLEKRNNNNKNYSAWVHCWWKKLSNPNGTLNQPVIVTGCQVAQVSNWCIQYHLRSTHAHRGLWRLMVVKRWL